MNILEYIEVMFQLALNGNTQGIFFWAAVYVFLVCLYSLVYQLRINRWPGVIGKLTNIGVQKFGSTARTIAEQDYVAGSCYQYQVDETRYQGSRVSPWSVVASQNMRRILVMQLKSVGKLPDNQVTVYYNPRKPEKSFLIKPGLKSQLFTAVLTCLPIVLYWLKYG